MVLCPREHARTVCQVPLPPSNDGEFGDVIHPFILKHQLSSVYLPPNHHLSINMSVYSSIHIYSYPQTNMERKVKWLSIPGSPGGNLRIQKG